MPLRNFAILQGRKTEPQKLGGALHGQGAFTRFLPALFYIRIRRKIARGISPRRNRGLLFFRDMTSLAVMENKKKAVARFTAGILGNVAVIGIGLAFYEQKWWCLFAAIVAAIMGAVIVWRTENA